MKEKEREAQCLRAGFRAGLFGELSFPGQPGTHMSLEPTVEVDLSLCPISQTVWIWVPMYDFSELLSLLTMHSSRRQAGCDLQQWYPHGIFISARRLKTGQKTWVSYRGQTPLKTKLPPTIFLSLHLMHIVFQMPCSQHETHVPATGHGILFL